MSDPQKFALHVPDDVLDGLRARLRRIQMIDDSPRKPASGMTSAYLFEHVGPRRDISVPAGSSARLFAGMVASLSLRMPVQNWPLCWRVGHGTSQ